MKQRTNRQNIVLRVAPAPGVGEGNVLSRYLAENRRWLDPVHVLVWLETEHPKLMEGCQRAEDMDAEKAQKALGLVEARLGQQRRFRHPRRGN